MEASVVNLYNQFQSLRAQVDGLNEGIEPRKLFTNFASVFVTTPNLWMSFQLLQTRL